MNAKELIEALAQIPPETPIRYAYQEDFQDWPTEVDITDVSYHGWLNDDEDDEDFDESEGHFGSVPLTQPREPGFLEKPAMEFPVFERILRDKLSETYPKFESVGFDGSLYWKSLEEYTEGDIIEYKGKEYRVRYGWHWTSYGPIPIYMAELDPVGFDRATHVPGSDSRMGPSEPKS
jgi:hypothetical protein